MLSIHDFFNIKMQLLATIDIRKLSSGKTQILPISITQKCTKDRINFTASQESDLFLKKENDGFAYRLHPFSHKCYTSFAYTTSG